MLSVDTANGEGIGCNVADNWYEELDLLRPVTPSQRGKMEPRKEMCMEVTFQKQKAEGGKCSVGSKDEQSKACRFQLV